MATTFGKIISIMKGEENLRFKTHPRKSEALVIIPTREFTNIQGDKMIPLFVNIHEHGELIKITAPCVFRLQNCNHPIELTKALLELSFKTKLIRWQLDGKDGEIRASVDIPLENAKLKRKQFLRSLYTIPMILDQYYQSIKDAMENGIVDIKRSGLPTEHASKPLELADLLKLAGGVMGLRKLLKDSGKL